MISQRSPLSKTLAFLVAMPPLVASVSATTTAQTPAVLEKPDVRMNQSFRDKMIEAGHKNVLYYNIADRNHGSLVKRFDEPDDPVSKLILSFIHRKRM